jgi:hypothetical protein
MEHPKHHHTGYSIAMPHQDVLRLLEAYVDPIGPAVERIAGVIAAWAEEDQIIFTVDPANDNADLRLQVTTLVERKRRDALGISTDGLECLPAPIQEVALEHGLTAGDIAGHLITFINRGLVPAYAAAKPAGAENHVLVGCLQAAIANRDTPEPEMFEGLRENIEAAGWTDGRLLKAVMDFFNAEHSGPHQDASDWMEAFDQFAGREIAVESVAASKM